MEDCPARVAASVYCSILSAFSLSRFSCMVIVGALNLGIPGLVRALIGGVSLTAGALDYLKTSLRYLNESRFGSSALDAL